jgi:RHS repeat-associated protein
MYILTSISQYLATYELASANLENLFFDDVDDRPGSTWNGDLKSARLNGADPERRVGTSMLMHVMAGDKVEMNVNNYYEGYDGQQDSPLPAEEMLGSIINTLVQGPGGSLPGEGHDVEQVNNAFNWPNFEKFQQLTEGSTDPSKPRAYLNYILFDEQMRMVNTGSGAFQANGNGSWTQIGTTAPMEIPSNGYLAVYLSNSSQMGCLTCSDVFFDQLVIRFTRGKLKEEAHYYPFGLPMAGMGSAAAGFKPNRRKYQSNEYIKDFGLNWMDFQARQYDPQLGRFLAVDPLASSGGQDKYSPYAAMGNMPESMIDPNGESAWVSMGQSMMSQMNTMGTLGAMFGADNFTVDAFGKIGIIDMKVAMGSLLSYMSDAKGGGSAASTYAMASIGFNILMNIDNPNYNTFIGFAGNNFIAHESGSDLLLGSRLMAGNLPTPGIETAASRNGESVLDGFNEATANLTPMGLVNLGAKVATGKNIYGKDMGGVNTLEATGPQIGRVGKGTTTLYRAVSHAEVDDIAKFGFRIKAGGYESGKLFAPTLQEATQFGKYNFGLDGIPNTIMKVSVPNFILNGAEKFGADGMNAISIPANQLHLLRGTPLNYSPWLR